MPPNQRVPLVDILDVDSDHGKTEKVLRCAILGCGMMGQEHCSYLLGFPDDVSIDFLCDPHEASIERCTKVIQEFAKTTTHKVSPIKLKSELELYELANQIDLLVVATPNYQHTDILMRWGQQDLTILLEKPVAVSHEQLSKLQSQAFAARIWVAMEYRFIPAIAKLIELLPSVGDIKMVTIRENRYPFLHKIGEWNRDREKTGDTLVEKCCHFFDLMRLIIGKEAKLNKTRALAQRGLNYQDEGCAHSTPVIDSAFVTLPFEGNTMACLELCMFAEGSRHQEEIIVTGSKGRLEAYLPENKVYQFTRPNQDTWMDRSVPPPSDSIGRKVYDCSDVAEVHHIDGVLPTHTGYHYCSTAVEWYNLLHAVRVHEKTNIWNPMVSLEAGIRAVEIGLHATTAIVNETMDD